MREIRTPRGERLHVRNRLVDVALDHRDLAVVVPRVEEGGRAADPINSALINRDASPRHLRLSSDSNQHSYRNQIAIR